MVFFNLIMVDEITQKNEHFTKQIVVGTKTIHKTEHWGN